MKVTVYFGNIRVIVPCGNGDILVRDLMDLAITRYKKATGKPPNSLVTIHNLKSSRDDGILYPDDQLNDVADDREQIIAIFEESASPVPNYNYGDGASTSSVCTGSPDIFSVEVSSHGSMPYSPSDVEITEDPPPIGVSTLQVRRGSEPALNCLFPSSPTDPNKRWSTAVVINTHSSDQQESPLDHNCKPSSENSDLNGESKFSSLNFSRGSGRLSILGNNAETFRWLDAAHRKLKDARENSPVKSLISNSAQQEPGSDTSSTSEERETTVILKNEAGPLGIHVVPDYDNNGRDTGLIIQGIEAGGRIDRDGRFHVGDRITEINGQSLQNVSFQAAQEIFKNALKAHQIKLELIRGGGRSHSKIATVPKKPPPPVYPKPTNIEDQKKVDDDSSLVEGEARVGGISTKVATVTPTKKVPSSTSHRLATANTRRIGKKITVELVKGNAGLGFSITTRDNPAGGNSPIYIKNVLPKGAAIEDGQLQPGDRLLEVNGVEMTGKSQTDAVSILRNIPLGGVVNLVVSRQEQETVITYPQGTDLTSVKLEDESGIFPWKYRDILTFQIPLNDTSSAGLGVSVKGKSTSAANDPVDLGIFIKSVIPGGAASKDGRLQTNDQLVNINGISLLGMSNSDAMETLRKAMTQMDGPIPNLIILTIARRTSAPSEEEQNTLTPHQKNDGSFVPPINNYSNSVNGSFEHSHMEKQILQPPTVSDCNISLHSNDLTKEPFVDNSEIDLRIDDNLPGNNPVIERLTGQVSSGRFKLLPNDTYFCSNRDKAQSRLLRLNEERNKLGYMSTVSTPSCETVIIEDEYSPASMKGKPLTDKNSLQKDKPNANSNGDSKNPVPAGSQLSLEEEKAGFERDGFGRQSMSEKRHAQLDAKNTDTYQRNKKAREERDRTRQSFDEDYLDETQWQSETGQGTNASPEKVAPNSNSDSKDDEQLGPSLGLRKSSSLESLQTMIQELNKDEEAIKKALKSTSPRGSRSRGCNESFRAAVDRSYEAPPASTMETLDEESESGSSVGQILVRNSEMAEGTHPGIASEVSHDDMLNMYCRNSKSKKKSLLKGLGSVFKFGKNRKVSQDGKIKYTEEGNQDSEQLHVQQVGSKEPEKLAEHSVKFPEAHKKQVTPQVSRESLPSLPIEAGPNRQERMQSLREQHQRLHQKRQGQYPLEQKEEFYENEIKEKEKHKMGVESAHTRSLSLDTHKDIVPINSRHGLAETNRYSHYMNYKEIQQHINQHLHHDQIHHMPKLYSRNDNTMLPKKHLDRPSSNYFEYESVHLHRHAVNQTSELDTSSLPRGSHLAEQSVMHPQSSINKHYYRPENHDSTTYGRMKVHPCYPNSALYSHIVPGSKV